MMPKELGTNLITNQREIISNLTIKLIIYCYLLSMIEDQGDLAKLVKTSGNSRRNKELQGIRKMYTDKNIINLRKDIKDTKIGREEKWKTMKNYALN